MEEVSDLWRYEYEFDPGGTWDRSGFAVLLGMGRAGSTASQLLKDERRCNLHRFYRAHGAHGACKRLNTSRILHRSVTPEFGPAIDYPEYRC